MYAEKERFEKNNRMAVANSVARNTAGTRQHFVLEDNRPGVKPVNSRVLQAVSAIDSTLMPLEARRAYKQISLGVITPFVRHLANVDGVEPGAVKKNAEEMPAEKFISLFNAWSDIREPHAVKHETATTAPDNSNKSRAKVGVGEKLTFTSNYPCKWESNGGWMMSDQQDSCTWFAPPEAGIYTISSRIPGEMGKDSHIIVVQPEENSAEKIQELGSGELNIKDSERGAGMYLRLRNLPLDVSFSRIMTREGKCEASDIWGDWFKKSDYTFRHNTAETYLSVDNDNTDMGKDFASTGKGLSQAKGEGGFLWEIPNFYKVKGFSQREYRFRSSTQKFTLDEDGTVTISKQGAHVKRKPTI